MNLTAKSYFENLSRTSFATPKLPDPISFTISYLSILCTHSLSVLVQKTEEPIKKEKYLNSKELTFGGTFNGNLGSVM